MRLFHYGKDGGEKSTVWGFWLCEFKSLFSIVLLRFENGSREAYHNHAFNSVSWVLKGDLREHHLPGDPRFRRLMRCNNLNERHYTPSLSPIITRRDTFHQVISEGRTWVLSFRGPWAKSWYEYLPKEERFVALTDGRVEAK